MLRYGCPCGACRFGEDGWVMKVGEEEQEVYIGKTIAHCARCGALLRPDGCSVTLLDWARVLRENLVCKDSA